MSAFDSVHEASRHQFVQKQFQVFQVGVSESERSIQTKKKPLVHALKFLLNNLLQHRSIIRFDSDKHVSQMLHIASHQMQYFAKVFEGFAFCKN